jgi:intron-binding protein aquarius
MCKFVLCGQDTFLDLDHVKASFPGNELQIVNNSGGDAPVPPFRVTFPWGAEVEAEGAGSKRKVEGEGIDLPRWSKPLVVESYAPPHPGPYPQDRPRVNTIRFTPVQVRKG